MSSPAIKLAPERHAQIKAIAAALDLSITDTVARMINTEVTAGTIPAGFEGVNIHHKDDGVLFGFDDQPPVHFTPDDVANLVNHLNDFANPEKPAELNIVILKNNEDCYRIERKGSGVKLTVPLRGVTKSFSFSIAREVADLLVEEA